MVYRVKAQLRRQQYQNAVPSHAGGLLTAGPLTLDEESCRAYKDGQELSLTGREFLLLACLMENAERDSLQRKALRTCMGGIQQHL